MAGRPLRGPSSAFSRRSILASRRALAGRYGARLAAAAVGGHSGAAWQGEWSSAGRDIGRKRAVPGCGRRDSHGSQSGSCERDLCNAGRRARRLCGAHSPPGYYISGDPPGTREVYCGQWSVVPTSCVSPRAVY